MGKEGVCDGDSCQFGKCTPCAYLGLFVIIPYSIYLLTAGRLLGLVFLLYGTFIAWPLISMPFKRTRGRSAWPSPD